MKTKTAPPKTVSEYVAAFPPGARNVLKTVRTTIRKALPDAERRGGLDCRKPRCETAELVAVCAT